MSNLIPTPRTDKNGRTVIRHMKPGAASSSTKRLPAPTASSTSNADDILSGILSTIKDMDFPDIPLTLEKPERSPFYRTALLSLRYALAKINLPERAANDYISRAEEPFTTYCEPTLKRIQNHPWSHEAVKLLCLSASTWTETTVNDYMEAMVALDLTDGYRLSGMHIDSWKLYPNLAPADNEGDYPKERLSQIVALHHVTEHMNSKGMEPYWIDEQTGEVDSYYVHDAKLREFILNPEEPYKREDIVEVITTNDAFDVDRIKSMLDSGSASLSSGIL